MDHVLVKDIDFTKLSEMGNLLLSQLDQLREEDPIMWSENANAWLITRHADVKQGFSGSLPLSNDRFSGNPFSAIPLAEQPREIPILYRSAPFWIVNSDAPRHTRLRKLMTRAFGHKVIEGMRSFAKETIRHTLDNVKTGESIDFIDDIARAITGRVILQMFGLSESYLDRFQKWSFALNTAFGSPQPSAESIYRAEETLREMTDALLPEIESRRVSPREDFLTQLVLAREGNDMLDQEEVMGICYVALIAGHDTTMNSMALGTDLLARNPSQVEYLLEHQDRVVNSVMELARASSMSTAQPRLVSADFEWHGKQLRKGDVAFLVIAAANRDPRAFADPLKLDLSRTTDQVATFGPGIHHCIGHMLAKMQLGEFFPSLFQRFNVELMDDELHFIPSFSFRGLEYMNVRLTNRA